MDGKETSLLRNLLPQIVVNNDMAVLDRELLMIWGNQIDNVIFEITPSAKSLNRTLIVIDILLATIGKVFFNWQNPQAVYELSTGFN